LRLGVSRLHSLAPRFSPAPPSTLSEGPLTLLLLSALVLLLISMAGTAWALRRTKIAGALTHS
jgi:hypothetical protein